MEVGFCLENNNKNDGIYNSSTIFDILHDEILSLKIKPGELLPETKLCKRFNLSRTPVRSALRRLEDAGLVEINPYKYTMVPLINLDEVSQIIYMRYALETSIVKDFIKVGSPMVVEKLRYIIRMQQISCDNEADIDEFYKLDASFHEVLFEETGKKYLWKVINEFQIQYTRFRKLDILEKSHIEQIIEEHQKIFDIIEKKAVEEVDKIMYTHFYGGLDRVRERVSTDYTDFFKNENTK